MFTFATFVTASGTLIASGVAEQILLHYGKEDLAETLKKLTIIGVSGYAWYVCYKLIKTAAGTFLGIF